MKFQWTFDRTAQELRAPSGWTVTVAEIATWLQDRVYNRHDLSGPWAGWRIRGKTLIGPRGKRYTPDMLRQLNDLPCMKGNDLRPQPDTTPQPDPPKAEAPQQDVTSTAARKRW